MGVSQSQRPVLLFVAMFSGSAEVLDAAEQQLVARWGPVALRSERMPFTQTSYYDDSMGTGLLKELLVFEQLMDPAELAARKLESNELEQQADGASMLQVTRPLNIDPGYVTEAKLVLASTKDRDHRIYLQQGIFAEVTLYFHAGGWKTRPWTYPDYAQASYHQFLDAARRYLRERYRHM